MPESNSNDQHVQSEDEQLRLRVKVAAQIACLEQYREALTRPDGAAASEPSSTNQLRKETTAK